MQCSKAIEIMNKRNVDQLPVVNEDGSILGKSRHLCQRTFQEYIVLAEMIGRSC